MFNLKKTAVAVLALGGSAVFAGTMGAVCTPGNVTVPCEGSAWEIGGYALYLEPVHTGPFYSLGTIGGMINTIDAGWDWGFALEGAYHYGTGNDIKVTWNHVNFGANHFVSVADIRHYETNWDALNAEFGQLVELSQASKVRVHSGVQYARVNSSINRGIVGTGYNSDYNGFGPRIGADLNYVFGNGFGVYGKSAAGLLVGTSSFSDLVTPDTLSNTNTKVVPEFDAKIGVNYAYALAQGNLVFDAGYMWVDYFNIHQNTNSGGSVGRGSFAATGPYVGLRLVGEV
jgi:hypothetical protein